MKWKLGLYRGLLGLGVPKIRGTILGVPIIRNVVHWGLYWVPLILGNYHFWRFVHEGCKYLEIQGRGCSVDKLSGGCADTTWQHLWRNQASSSPSYGGFQKSGVPFWGPYNQNYSILGSIMGSPHVWKRKYAQGVFQKKNLTRAYNHDNRWQRGRGPGQVFTKHTKQHLSQPGHAIAQDEGPRFSARAGIAAPEAAGIL